jgi:hypothetical protein
MFTVESSVSFPVKGFYSILNNGVSNISDMIFINNPKARCACYSMALGIGVVAAQTISFIRMIKKDVCQ